MTALEPTTDEQWANLRRRFPSSEEDRHWRGDRYIKTGTGASFSRPQIDALRAAGLWCEHDGDEADRLTKVLHVIKDLVEEPYSRKVAIRGLNGWTPHAGQNPRDFDGPADPEPAPIERFTTKRRASYVAIFDGGEYFDSIHYGKYGEGGAQELGEHAVAILRRRHAKPTPRPMPRWQVSHSLGKYHLEHFDVLGHVNRRISFYDSQPHAKEALEAAADVLNGVTTDDSRQ